MSKGIQVAGLTAASAGQNGAEYYFEFRSVTKAFDEHVVLNNVSEKIDVSRRQQHIVRELGRIL